MDPLLFILTCMAAALLFLAATPRRFRRDDEWLVRYRLGRTSREGIRGPWGEHLNQYVLGDHVVFFAVPFVDRCVRVRGELKTAWAEVREVLPSGVKVTRPAFETSAGVWVVRARAYEEDAGTGQAIDLEVSDVTEVATLRELVARLSEAMAVGAMPTGP